MEKKEKKSKKREATATSDTQTPPKLKKKEKKKSAEEPSKKKIPSKTEGEKMSKIVKTTKKIHAVGSEALSLMLAQSYESDNFSKIKGEKKRLY